MFATDNVTYTYIFTKIHTFWGKFIKFNVVLVESHLNDAVVGFRFFVRINVKKAET